MFGIHDFYVFLVTGIILNLTPGPDNLYILGRSVAQGRNAGIASALGICTGTLVHTLAAALGLSAIITASATAFLVLKFAGAAYLLYLGLKMLLCQTSSTSIPKTFSSSHFAKIFRQGLITNVLNPKVALFFLAFMPQFIDSDSSSKFAAFLTLGLCFVANSTVWCLCLAWFSSSIGNRMRGSPVVSNALNKAAGGLFVLLGIRIAVTQ